MINRRLLYAVLFGIFIGAALLWSSIVQVPDSGADAEQAIRSVVTEFGEQLPSVSLLANKEELQQQIRAAYAPYVSDELLSAWREDRTTAPGRLTSCPWPDRIEITGIDALDSNYTVAGTIVLMTSVEVASVENDNAGERPVIFTVANVDGEWVVTAFDMRDANEDGE